jgi:hypothetical protein
MAGALFAWRALRMPSEFGAFTGAQLVNMADLVDRPKDFTGRLVTIEAQVRDQCTTMGCYFFIPSGNKKLRVDLQDIAMHAPMHEGKPARVEGQIVPYGDGYQLLASGVQFK